MLHSPEFWVLIGFLLFVGLILYLKLPSVIAGKLDERAAKIKAELEQAEKLHADARALLAQYQDKQKNALAEAQAIIAEAKAEAKRQADAAEADLAASLERRRVMAEAKIAQAEAQAIKDVREAAVDLAVAAAGRILTAELQGDRASQLIDQAITDVKLRLA